MRASRVGIPVVLALLLHASAGGYVVDSTNDAPDATPGDGICATTGNECTLRAAIEEANASPGMEWVQLDDTTYPRTIAGDLEITDDVGIATPYQVGRIDASGLGRVLHVHAGISVELSNVVLAGGSTAAPEGGAGIFNEGTLRLGRVAVIENTASVGAGIANAETGVLAIDEAFFNHNGPGAAILNDGNLTLEHADVSFNDGVGVENRRSAHLDFVQLTRNDGGGVLNYSAPAAIELLRSVLVLNRGIGALYSTTRASLRRSTVSGNRGESASAIYVAGGYLGMEDVTVGANGHPDFPQAALDGSGSAAVGAINTIVAGNFASAGDPDCRITVTSAGYNLMSCPLDAPDATTTAGDPRLGPLKGVPILWPWVGHTTFVHGLLPGSAAINHGRCIGWPDQRGGDRPQNGLCDVGAFEVTPLCKAGVAIAAPDMRIQRRPSDGRTTVKVRGRLAFPDPLDPVLQPTADGFQLRIENVASPRDTLLERTVLVEPLSGVDLGCGGWRSIGGGTRFRWKSPVVGTACDEGRVGKMTVGLKDARAGGGGIELATSVRSVMPAITGPLRMTIVLGVRTLNGNLAGDADPCAQHVFVCTGDAAGTKYTCS